MDIKTNWVTPPNQIIGLDHLGVQAPCINIYAQLLPGITNVTDRARYYSFYPWLLMAMSDAGYAYGDKFVKSFRNADVLFTLICLRHQDVCNDGNHHTDAAVGSIALTRALALLKSGNVLKLSTYSALEPSPDRYFKNKLGGLGQYYLGVLRSLNLMNGNTQHGVQTITDIGGKLASTFSGNLSVEQFLSVVSEDEVTVTTLDNLRDFCLCQLGNNPNEQNAMVELFAGVGSFLSKNKAAENDAKIRKQSLDYILRLAHVANERQLPFDIDAFRALTYCRSLDNCLHVNVDMSLKSVVEGWASYQRNELLSMSLQGIFFACLRSYELSGLVFSCVEELSEWFWTKGAGAITLSKHDVLKNYDELRAKLISSMPPFERWQDENHEIQCMHRLSHLSNQNSLDDSQLAEIVRCSLHILVALSGRKENKCGYSEDLFFPTGYFDYYPVNLNSFQRFLAQGSGEWVKLPIKECLTKLVSEWCLNAHLKVALRKLRQQSQSTFRFMPTDDGLNVISIPKPAHTQPRFKQTTAILKDIGLLTTDGAGNLKVTEIPSPFTSQCSDVA